LAQPGKLLTEPGSARRQQNARIASSRAGALSQKPATFVLESGPLANPKPGLVSPKMAGMLRTQIEPALILCYLQHYENLPTSPTRFSRIGFERIGFFTAGHFRLKEFPDIPISSV
jgi:hypothetical protein